MKSDSSNNRGQHCGDQTAVVAVRMDCSSSSDFDSRSISKDEEEGVTVVSVMPASAALGRRMKSPRHHHHSVPPTVEQDVTSTSSSSSDTAGSDLENSNRNDQSSSAKLTSSGSGGATSPDPSLIKEAGGGGGIDELLFESTDAIASGERGQEDLLIAGSKKKENVDASGAARCELFRD